MAVEALPSRFALRWNMMCGVMMLFLAGYFYYDGHYNKAYIEKETVDGKPTMDLKINQTYGPIGCTLAGLYFGYLSLALSRKKIVVDEKGLSFADGRMIPLASLTKIDKSKLKTKGKLLIEYELEGKPASVEIRDTVYDGVKDLLAEILRLTGKEATQSE